ncbi:hypothetical protein [Actinocrispum wychmicini]|uniref:Uncharacterized protein n=1 Tax=Actinocrispum wychmicini TaxID=1213861 RepID=A0A4R2JZ79_9PSEU|nr:hypothetical protein [Actinocrispum wychmicini]TCO62748.1 hypothetical protein EV192_102887 [Actinocrispum wychmicini]
MADDIARAEISRLMATLDHGEALDISQRKLLWAFLNAARSVVQVVEPPDDFSFVGEFGESFTAGPVDAVEFAASPRPSALMIIR